MRERGAMKKYSIISLVIVVCLVCLFIIKMGRRWTHNAMVLDASKSTTSFTGPYKLGASVKGNKELEEISPSEYKVIQKNFEDERVYKAPAINFLGLTWDMYY